MCYCHLWADAVRCITPKRKTGHGAGRIAGTPPRRGDIGFAREPDRKVRLFRIFGVVHLRGLAISTAAELLPQFRLPDCRRKQARNAVYTHAMVANGILHFLPLSSFVREAAAQAAEQRSLNDALSPPSKRCLARLRQAFPMIRQTGECPSAAECNAAA